MSPAREGEPPPEARSPGRPARRRSRKPTLRLVVPSQTAFLYLVREVTRRFAEAIGFDEPTRDHLALAVDEAATNVIKHAYGGAPDRTVEVRLDDRGGEFRVELVDTGAMVDPRALPRVDLERYASERRKGGLGVHLMEKVMDSVTFRRSARRNVCCLVKRKETGQGS